MILNVSIEQFFNPAKAILLHKTETMNEHHICANKQVRYSTPKKSEQLSNLELFSTRIIRKS